MLTHRWLKELLAYGAASALALGADTGTLLMLTGRAHWNYLPASAAGFVVGGIVAYILSVTLVFRFRRIHSTSLELGYFMGLGIVGLSVNSAAMFVSVGELGINLLLAKALAAGCTFTTNFALRRQLLFRPEVALR